MAAKKAGTVERAVPSAYFMWISLHVFCS